MIVCIVSAWHSPSTHSDEHNGFETISQWDFGAKEDTQQDGWPDGWVRRKDVKHPGFIPIQIRKKSTSDVEVAEVERLRRSLGQLVLAWETNKLPWEVIPESIPSGVNRFIERTFLDPFLSIEMDGGSVEIYSPKVPVGQHSLYGLQVDIRSEAEYFNAFGQLRFLDSKGQLLFITKTNSISGIKEWTRARTTGSYQDDPRIAFVQVALTIEPNSTNAFRGSFGFDRVRIVQMPKIDLQLNRTNRMYSTRETVDLRCLASGLKSGPMRVEMKLIDHNGSVIDRTTRELQRVDSDKPLMVQTPAVAPKSRGASASGAVHWKGECDWSIDPLQPGYYQLVTQLKQLSTVFFEQSESFVVLPRQSSMEPDLRFGWTLNETAYRWKIEDFLELLREGRTGRIKVPVWFDSKSLQMQKLLCETIDKLQNAEISCVGIIHSPLGAQSIEKDSLQPYLQTAALEDPSIWQPSLEPVFRAMCLRVLDFQIGYDDDVQFANNPRYGNSIEILRTLLRRYAPEASIVAAKTPWLAPPPNRNIDRWQISDELGISESEWDLSVAENGATLPPWTSITPVSSEKYSLNVRTRDLASRMIASIRKPDGRSVAWISDPLSDASGFLSPDGTPREMFLPYRTMVDALLHKSYVGKLDLKSGSENALLSDEQNSCLVVWSAKPTQEQLFLGANATAFDIWGRPVPIQTIQTSFGPEQRFQIDQWPVIVKGVDTQVALWRMGLNLDAKRIDSLVGLSQEVQVVFKNPFSYPASGRIELVAPDVLANEVESALFEVGPKSTSTIPVKVLLRSDISALDTPVHIIAYMNGVPPVQFAVERMLRIGNDEVDIETRYRISDADELWIDIDVINYIDTPISFDCMLLIPDRRRERVIIPRVVDRTTKTLILPKASELLNQTLWLRCEQIDSRRVLNYRIKIEPEADDSEAEEAQSVEDDGSSQGIPGTPATPSVASPNSNLKRFESNRR